MSGKQGTFLEADNDINITAAEQTHKERSTNKSSGFNAGLAIKVSNGAAVGATLGGNHGKGYGNGDETTYVASHVGDSQSKTVIQAGGDANLIGSQVKGKRVEVKCPKPQHRKLARHGHIQRQTNERKWQCDGRLCASSWR